MGELDDCLSIKDVNIPGTHDSSTQFCQFSFFSKCQNISVSEMLRIGVRAFDIRVNGEDVVHSFCKCKKTRFGNALKLNDVISCFYKFLNDNPTETLIIIFKNDGKISGNECLIVLKRIINLSPEKWYLKNKFPLLSEVRGKIVLFNRIDGSFGVDFSQMPYQGSNKSCELGEFSPNGIDNVVVQDRYLLPRKQKWEKAVVSVLNNEDKFSGVYLLNHLSAAGNPFIPRFNSRYLNRKFYNYSLMQKGNYGTLMFDFINYEITRKIINSNFN